MVFDGSDMLDYLVTAAAGLLSVAFAWFAGWVREKMKRELFRRGVDMLKNACSVAVGEIYQTYVDEIKKSRADGKLTEAERLAAIDRAVQLARSLLGVKGIKLLIKAWPGITASTVDSVIKPNLEAEIADKKSEYRALRLGVAAGDPLRQSQS